MTQSEFIYYKLVASTLFSSYFSKKQVQNNSRTAPIVIIWIKMMGNLSTTKLNKIKIVI